MAQDLTVQYRLPATAVRVDLQLVPLQCDAGGIHAKATSTVTAIAAATAETYDLRLPRSSWWRKANMTVNLRANGTIADVSAGATDNRLTMAMSVLRIATSVGWFTGDAGSYRSVPHASCRPVLAENIRRRAALTARLNVLRRSLAIEEDLKKLEESQKFIAVLVAERLRLEDEATLRLTEVLDLQQTRDATIRWKGSDLAPWFDGLPAAETFETFSLTYDAGNLIEPAATVSAGPERWTGFAGFESNAHEPSPDCAPDCLYYREPVRQRFRLTVGEAERLVVGERMMERGAELGSADILIAQRGLLRTVPFGTSLGEQWNMELAFSEFGAMTKAGRSAEGRGATVLAGVEGLVTNYNTYVDAETARAIAEMKAQTDLLTAQQNLNRARYCEAIIAAGGFVCPDAPAAPSAP